MKNQERLCRSKIIRNYALKIAEQRISLEELRSADPTALIGRLAKLGETMAHTALQDRREACVREHLDSENAHAFDVTLRTFAHPRYELVATGDVYDGEEAVLRYYQQTRTAFPDQRNEIHAIHHAEDAIIVEFDLLGTHLGPLRGLPPTGRPFRARMSAFFLFESDRIVVERIYFDSGTILRQLGLSHDPQTLTGRLTTALTHPVTILGAYRRKLLGGKVADKSARPGGAGTDPGRGKS